MPLSKGFGWQGGRERDWIVSSLGQLVPLPSVFNLFFPPSSDLLVCLHDEPDERPSRSPSSPSLPLLSFARFRTAELWSIVDFLKEHKRKLFSLREPLWSGLRKLLRARVHSPKEVTAGLLTTLLKEHSRALILHTCKHDLATIKYVKYCKVSIHFYSG